MTHVSERGWYISDYPIHQIGYIPQNITLNKSLRPQAHKPQMVKLSQEKWLLWVSKRVKNTTVKII